MEVVEARPISSVQVRSEVIVGVIGPAAVVIVNSSASVQPWRRRYRTASRAPLPESSASDPSGLKMRSSATRSVSSLRASSRTPSDPTPKCGSQMRLILSGLSSQGRLSASTMT